VANDQPPALHVNIEQLEAEIVRLPADQRAVVELGGRAAFVLTMLIQNAIARGELRGQDAGAFASLCLGFDPLFAGCPNVQTRIQQGWNI
jgi:hypothetical protein